MTKSCSLLYRRCADYTSWCSTVFQCSLSLSTAGLGRWTSLTFRLTLTRPRLSAGASVVLQRCVKKGQHTGSRAAHGFRQQRERGVRPRADQSKHTNETLIGLSLPVLAVCTEFPLLSHTGVHLVLPCQQVLRQYVFSECVFFFYLCSSSVLSERYVMQKVWPTSTQKPLKTSRTSNTCEYISLLVLS